MRRIRQSLYLWRAILLCCTLVVLLDRDGHHRGHITPPTFTHTRTRTHARTHTEFLLSHGSLVDAQSGCCRSELDPRSLAASFPPDLACLPLGFSIFYSEFQRCLHMASSDGLDGCLQRGRSQSDPNILTEPGIDLAHGTGKTDGVILCIYTDLIYSYRSHVAGFY